MSILTNSFWLGDLTSFHTILTLEDAIQERMASALKTGEKFDMYSGYYDDEEADEAEEQGYQVNSGIAIIPVQGNLTTKETWLTRLFGMTTYDGIKRMLAHASENDQVNRIVMDFNTPGGSSEGIDEIGLLINKIDADVKPIHGYTSGGANSAGYWMISSCRDVTCTKMATLGSIGVVTIHQEISQMLKDRGVEVTVFRDGEMKAKPNMYEKLDEKTKNMVNSSLSLLGNFFLDHVAEQRGFDRSTVRADVGEGRVFFGQEAVANGLADRIMFFDDFIHKLSLLDSIETNEIPSRMVNLNISSTMNKDEMVKAISDAIEGKDFLLSNESNPQEDNTMSANTEAGNEAGKLIKTANGDLTMEQIEASVELGTLEMTDELKAEIAKVVGEAEAEPAAEDDAGDTDLEAGDTSAEMSSDASEETEEGDPVVAHIQSQLTEQISENTKLQLELETVKAKLSGQDDTVTALSQIAINSCQNMSLVIGGAQIDLSSMDTAILLAHHNQLAAKFKETFKTGGVAAVETERENADEPEAEVMSAPLSTVTFSNK